MGSDMTKLDKTFLIIGALSLMTTAMLSAYGFHGLADTLTEADRLSWRWARRCIKARTSSAW